MQPVEFPDVTTLVVDHLAGVIDEPVYSDTPNPRPDVFVVVRRVGGPRRTLVSDGAQMMCEVWAADDVRAVELAAVVRAHVLSLDGEVVDGVQFYRADELSGPQWNPDPDSGSPRYTFQSTLAVRGTPLDVGS